MKKNLNLSLPKLPTGNGLAATYQPPYSKTQKTKAIKHQLEVHRKVYKMSDPVNEKFIKVEIQREYDTLKSIMSFFSTLTETEYYKVMRRLENKKRALSNSKTNKLF